VQEPILLISFHEQIITKPTARVGRGRHHGPALVCALLALMAFAGCGARQSADGLVVLETRTRSLVEEGRSISVHYPCITSCANENAMEWFNERMRSIADSVYASGLKCSSSFTLEYDVVHNADGVVSLLFTSCCDESSAQLSRGLFSFNADLVAMKEIELADMFDPSSPWLHRLSQLCRSELREMLHKQGVEDTNMIEEGTGEATGNFRTFVIASDTLGIKFGSGRVAGYSAGEPMVVLPFAMIGDVLAKNGVAGRLRK
jgi:hypothetical protein